MLIQTQEYNLLEKEYPHVARVVILEAELEKLRHAKRRSIKRPSEKLRAQSEIEKIKMKLLKEHLYLRWQKDYHKWKSKETREKIGERLRSASAKVRRAIKKTSERIIQNTREKVIDALPPSIRYLGSWDFSSEELLNWSRKYTTRSLNMGRRWAFNRIERKAQTPSK